MTSHTAAESYRHCAAVYRTEADARRHSPMACDRRFAVTLETWAANAERRAREAAAGEQPDLFGETQ